MNTRMDYVKMIMDRIKYKKQAERLADYSNMNIVDAGERIMIYFKNEYRVFDNYKDIIKLIISMENFNNTDDFLKNYDNQE